MGGKRADERNEKAKKNLLSYSAFMNRITPQFVKRLDHAFQRKIQNHVKIVSAFQYQVYLISIVSIVIALQFVFMNEILRTIINIVLLIIVLFLRASFSDGGHKKRNSPSLV